MVCSPINAGWNDAVRVERWRELAYFHLPEFETAEVQHRRMIEALEKAGAEVVSLAGDEELSLDGVYTHDASLVTNHGAVLMRMGKKARAGEPPLHGRFYENLGIPVLGTIEPPGTTESGDMVWLDERTLLVGRGYRTNQSGIEQLRALLAPRGIDVIAAPLPHGPGPDACLHLMSLMSILDEQTALVDLSWIAVPTVELLSDRGYQWIEIEASERDTMACNVLSLGGKRLLALEENELTNSRMRERGFTVETFPGSELCQNGGGGPTCLTRPLVRESL
jgi:N-dimethylarginine dimethylaminohydrolase